MPRRPRPNHRAPPRGKGALPQRRKQIPPTNTAQKILKSPVANIHEDSSADEDRYSDQEIEGEGETSDSEDESGDVEVDDEDADAPRVSQWIDEDEFERVDGEASEEDGDEEEEPEASPSQLRKLRNNLSNLPFGALRKAQYALSHAEAVSDSEDDDDNHHAGSEGDDAPATQSSRGQTGAEWSTKPHKDIPKRSNKHAPMEITSKKPVTRLRQVVEVKKVEPRDPRFLSVAGEFKADKFQQNYGFLTEIHNNELKTLRDNLKRARKMLNNAPRHLRADYEAEVQRLELAVKRTESIVNKERMDRIQQEALRKVSKDEREKRKEGKGNWYLKKSEKRELVTRARYEALAAEGGRRAVKKAIEKRQKKISQKEKKSRPFPKSGPPNEETRKRNAGEDSAARKRRRVG